MKQKQHFEKKKITTFFSFFFRFGSWPVCIVFELGSVLVLEGLNSVFSLLKPVCLPVRFLWSEPIRFWVFCGLDLWCLWGSDLWCLWGSDLWCCLCVCCWFVLLELLILSLLFSLVWSENVSRKKKLGLVYELIGLRLLQCCFLGRVWDTQWLDSL